MQMDRSIFMLRVAMIAVAMSFVSAPVTAEPAAPAVAAKFNVDMPIETIAADPAAKAVLDAVFPGMTTHTMYDQFKSMSLKQLQPMASDQITDVGIAKLSADLAALK
jgi:hypothetical protein